jgi:hypothetical protein
MMEINPSDFLTKEQKAVIADAMYKKVLKHINSKQMDTAIADAMYEYCSNYMCDMLDIDMTGIGGLISKNMTKIIKEKLK